MKISFIWPWEKAKWVLPNWRDGHRKVIEELGKVHHVDWFIGEDAYKPIHGYDFNLFWDDGSNLVHHNINGKKGLMLTTGNTVSTIWPKDYDVIYCESQPIVNMVRSAGLRAIKAMGTDTDFFMPDATVEKSIEYFYPATFSPWKLQSQIAHLGDKLLCVGTIQPDGQEEYQACIKNGVKTEVGYFPAEKIRDYYIRSTNVIIPAIHGSERTVLESMSMDILPKVVNQQNSKALSFVEECKLSDMTPREFVLTNYSHKQYLEAILRGME